MTEDVRQTYNTMLTIAFRAVEHGNRAVAMDHLREAMRCANTTKDKRYRRAVFRALSFTRRIPAAA